jgi:hypothetical protein
MRTRFFLNPPSVWTLLVDWHLIFGLIQARFSQQPIVSDWPSDILWSLQCLAAAAVLLSAINLAGGTIVTKKMLDMFRRPTDPAEFNHYYVLPGMLLVDGWMGGLWLVGVVMGVGG